MRKLHPFQGILIDTIKDLGKVFHAVIHHVHAFAGGDAADIAWALNPGFVAAIVICAVQALR